MRRARDVMAEAIRAVLANALFKTKRMARIFARERYLGKGRIQSLDEVITMGVTETLILIL